MQTTLRISDELYREGPKRKRLGKAPHSPVFWKKGCACVSIKKQPSPPGHIFSGFMIREFPAAFPIMLPAPLREESPNSGSS